MPFFHRKTVIVFLTISWAFALSPAYGQGKHSSWDAYGVGYNHMGEQYLKSGVCDMVSPGNAARAAESLATAEQAFQKAIEMDPTCVEAHLNLARLYHFEQEFDKAVSAYEEAIRLSPGDINMLVDMALLQIEMDRTDEAIRFLEQAKRLAGDDRTLQHLNRFVRKSGPSEYNEDAAVKRVNSKSAR